ncbi:MAG: 2-oxo acid dehydrogenase subunit E2 [Actinobacteria bacterium]|nr:2-oxo acid dehydrogenase subunit E2 [Actinomycetota bacterium]
MMHEVIMPKLGLTMESGKIEKWHKKEGDKVEIGEVLFEVMTDKVTLEVESYDSGILRKILRTEGEEVPVTEVIAYIGDKDEEIPQYELKKEAEAKIGEMEIKEAEETAGKVKEVSGILKEKVKISPIARKLAEKSNLDITKITGTGPRGRILREDVEKYIKSAEEERVEKRVIISPLARKTAKELGIDYRSEKISGSGPGGRIVKEDVIAYSKEKEKAGRKAVVPQPASVAIKSSSLLTGIRKVIAERMSYSKSNIPHIVLDAKANTTKLMDLREKLKEKILEKYGIKVTYTDFILKSTAVALRENLEVNSTFSNGDYIIYDDINVGVAVSLEEGLIVPTIFNCDELEVLDIAKKRVELVGKAREGKLSLEEISNGTFTVTNLGMYGIRSFSPIINPPQAAILAVGEIYTEPVVINGKIKPESFINLSIACDHRIIDGTIGAKFLRKIVELIENPAKLVN